MTDEELLKALAKKVEALEKEVADLRKLVDRTRDDAWAASYDAALRG